MLWVALRYALPRADHRARARTTARGRRDYFE
jgi:hypothetical protein